MDLGIADRVALVTASSKGLGKATAAALAADGARVMLCARTRDDLTAAVADMPGEAHGVVADVTEPDAPARLLEEAVRYFGRLDILVANAGGPPPGRSLDVDDDAILAAVEANLLTSVRLVRAAVPEMRKRHWGRICLIGSVSVKQPIATLALSNTSRTGLWAWAKTAAADLFGHGITLNMACPGLHATDRVKELAGGAEAGPMGEPADFGRVVAFLCSEPAKFVTGAALQVDGGTVQGLL